MEWIRRSSGFVFGYSTMGVYRLWSTAGSLRYDIPPKNNIDHSEVLVHNSYNVTFDHMKASHKAKQYIQYLTQWVRLQ